MREIRVRKFKAANLKDETFLIVRKCFEIYVLLCVTYDLFIIHPFLIFAKIERKNSAKSLFHPLMKI